MASIVTSVFGEKALQLGGEEFVRKMRFGNSWNRICIAVRCAFNGVANITANPRFSLGVCSNDTDTFASATCAGFVGATFNTSILSNYTYDAAGYYTYASSGNYGCVTKKIGNVVTDVALGGATGYLGATTGTTPRQLITCTIIARASSSSYTVSMPQVNVGEFGNAARFYDLLRVAEDELKTSPFSSAFVSAVRGPSTATALPSVMDTVSIYWSKVTPTVEVYDIVVIRFD